MEVAVIGTGYVGLIAAACLADKGHNVICVDECSDIVEKINNKKSTISEKGLDEIIKANAGIRLQATDSIEIALDKAQVVIVAVGTPYDYKNESIDLTAIEKVMVEIGHCLKDLKRYVVVVVKSTVIPTTTETMAIPILERVSGKKVGQDFGVCMNPEFLREGCAVDDFQFPDRIVVGCIDERSYAVVKEMYSVFDAQVISTNLKTAEMIKYSSNSLFATLISFSNEIANICSQVGGIDVEDVMKGVHLDHRLNPEIEGKRINPGMLTYIKAGCGFGGSCFPKDVKALISFSKKNNLHPAILESVIDTNEKQPLRVVHLLNKIYPNLTGLTISVLGLSFKPDTGDIRESPAVKIIEELLRKGAKVKVYDPVVKNLHGDQFSPVEQMSSWKDALNGSDAAIVATKWDEFRVITQDDLLKLMRKAVLIDARRLFEKHKFTKVKYLGIGYTD